MTNLYVIIGEQNTRKSSTVRALSGFHQRGSNQTKPHYIALTNGNTEDFYIEPTSLQEKRINSKDLINKAKHYNNALICLRENSFNNLPDYYSYLNDFITAGWNIKGLAVLGASNLQKGIPISSISPIYETNTINIASNEIAHRIRNSWNWL
ncbi:hypothetical protein ABE288_20480 [Bacillus salipaludis]|uniref:hypothetical protein n=1 Tax=Bacillus salipaludis TaxID=2547811 RepID=UPI003D24BB03